MRGKEGGLPRPALGLRLPGLLDADAQRLAPVQVQVTLREGDQAEEDLANLKW